MKAVSVTPSVCSAAFLIAYAPGAIAGAFYCGPNTVYEGLRAAEIETRCGPPAIARTIEEPVYARLENGTMIQTGVDVSQVWYFDLGSNQFVAQVTIRDSVTSPLAAQLSR